MTVPDLLTRQRTSKSTLLTKSREVMPAEEPHEERVPNLVKRGLTRG